VPTFYQLLSVEPTATADEIKKAFRAEIARYHPDKVQHLGKEFQEMAATRAAQLTEAYRTLMNPELRSEYDLHYVGSSAPAAQPPPAAGSQGSTPPQAAPRPTAKPEQPPPPPATGEAGAKPPPRFAKEQATRDEFVRKATLGRLRQVLATEYGSICEESTKGFDFDCSAKSKKFFSRGGGQRFVVRFVPRVDRAAIQEVWGLAQKGGESICIFLMGNGLAPARELADAIAEMRKKSRGEGGGICLIPIDVRDWTAHIPADAPPGCKTVLQKLRDTRA
jgi:curved DNA-binding protein CbpA